MSELLSATLFQSETRTMLLELLFVRGLVASVSELARRTKLSPRAVGNEVRHLLPTGLVRVETVGGADVVRANLQHSAARHLRALLQTPAEPASDGVMAQEVRQSLVAWGAPVAGVKARQVFSLHESLLLGLVEARRDGTVLRVLPAVLARNLDAVAWADLKEEARRRKLKAELGVVVELTATLLGREDLNAQVADLHDRRRTTRRFFPEVKSRFEAQLAKQRSPVAANRWGFWMNVSEDSFRSMLERHRA